MRSQYQFNGRVFSGYVYQFGELLLGLDPRADVTFGLEQVRKTITEKETLKLLGQELFSVFTDPKKSLSIQLTNLHPYDDNIERIFSHVDFIAAQIAAERGVAGHVLRRSGERLVFMPAENANLTWDNLTSMAIMRQRFSSAYLNAEKNVAIVDFEPVLAMFSDMAGVGTVWKMVDENNGTYEHGLLKGLKISSFAQEEKLPPPYLQRPKWETYFVIERDGIAQPPVKATFENMREKLLPLFKEMAKEQWGIEAETDLDAFCNALIPDETAEEGFILSLPQAATAPKPVEPVL
ncbi:MAG: hypothetical protein GC136_07855 [Alphaproteobacteria bacterium]|nr:hypothetical protein [Alphaproteobacteria bacterium]